jgi:hypothetical protein
MRLSTMLVIVIGANLVNAYLMFQGGAKVECLSWEVKCFLYFVV